MASQEGTFWFGKNTGKLRNRLAELNSGFSINKRGGTEWNEVINSSPIEGRWVVNEVGWDLLIN